MAQWVQHLSIQAYRHEFQSPEPKCHIISHSNACICNPSPPTGRWAVEIKEPSEAHGLAILVHAVRENSKTPCLIDTER